MLKLLEILLESLILKFKLKDWFLGFKFHTVFFFGPPRIQR